MSPTTDGETDLYRLAGTSRQRPPKDSYWRFGASAPPLRNADAGNLCATLLGLEQIPDSTLRSFHDGGSWPFREAPDAGATVDAGAP